MIFLEKSKNVDFGLFGLCSGPLGGPCTAKMGPEDQKVDEAGKKLAVGDWHLGGRKWPEIGKNRIFGKSKVGAFV